MNPVKKNNKIIQKLVKDPSYKVQKNGLIKRLNAEGKFVPAPVRDGYNGRSKITYKGTDLFVSRVVYAAHGSQALKHDKVIDHKNSDPSNNSIKNLQQITQAENSQKRVRGSRFTKNELKLMRSLYREGMRFNKIAKLMKRHEASVTHAIRLTRKGV